MKRTYIILIILFYILPVTFFSCSGAKPQTLLFAENTTTSQDRTALSKWSGQEYQKPEEQVLLKALTPMQYKVTQQEGTEPPFANEYWNNHSEGIYVDIVSGEPLFSSKDKFESGTGWPSFTRPLVPENIIEKIDATYGMIRTEVRSTNADSHLGHMFDDGPLPTGLRYCINSASLRFISKEDLEKEGYGEYAVLFK